MSKAEEKTDAASAPALFRALRRLPHRTAQLLSLRTVDGRTDAECAALYGVAPEAYAVHLLRAAKLWAHALSAPGEGPVLATDVAPEPAASEAERAASLLRALGESPAAAAKGDAELRALSALLQRAVAEGPELRRLAAEHERAERESPRARREDLLRRVALVVLVAVALWLYLRNRG